MTESEFISLSDHIFMHIEQFLDNLHEDFDCQNNGNVLTLEHDSGEQIVINRHLATFELWIAAKSGGYHFAPKNGIWYSEREQTDFFTLLSRVLSVAADKNIKIPSFQAA